jgi:Protein of Unknown function (DUF2784)
MAALYLVLADSVLALHFVFVLWVVLGVLVTRNRPVLRWLHISCLVWGILVEVTPWPCPLTGIENWLELKANITTYQGTFLLHYLDKLVYPDISPTLLTVAAVTFCAWNLAVYAGVLFSAHFRRL